MVNNNKFYKSEQGSKAAWKGFTSQTMYIANRLLNLKDDSEFYPEAVEDLMIKRSGVVSELVQIKNLSSDLSLSDIKPKNEDSFFRRFLAFYECSQDILLKIVSFGEIGQELQGVIDGKEASRATVRNKLTGYGYDTGDINVIFDKLIIEKVDESTLIDGAHNILRSNIETMVAPNEIFDILTSYVRDLSRYNGGTSKEKWDRRTQEIAVNLASLSGVANEYGKTILPIFEYRLHLSDDALHNEYLAGVNARPQHIRVGLDIPRSFWLDRIASAFDVQNTVLIKGASGQGKSSMAYRYLLDNFPESSILCIEKLTSAEQALNVRVALSGIAKNKVLPIIAYIDVEPYDTSWVWLCEKLQSHGADLKILITIREEDYRRSPVDFTKHSFEEISLIFEESEAAELFQKYSDHNFLSFESAWTSFGQAGPLMEFAYMLNQSETLRSRLTSQIDNIIRKDGDCADGWLKALSVISYAGKHNLKVNLTKLFSVVSCEQQLKMRTVFENEYFFRIVDSGRYVESLHNLRALLLYDILSEKLLDTELDVLITSLSSIDENALIMLVAYIYDNGIDNDLVSRLVSVSYDSWNLYAGVLNGLLWAEVFSYYSKNKAIFLEGDKLINSSFALICVTDITGFIDVNMDGFWEVFEKEHPGGKAKIDEMIAKLSSRILTYSFVKSYIDGTINSLPLCKTLNDNELTSAGYSLFWLAKLGYCISETQCNPAITSLEKAELLDEHLNFIVGVQMQGWTSFYNTVYDKLKQQIITKYNLVSFDDSGNNISAISIADIFDEGASQQINHELTMSIVMATRRLSVVRERYCVKVVGQDVMEGIILPDTQKNIPSTNLHWDWITQLNGCMCKLSEYPYMPSSWDICLQNIIETRSKILSIAQKYADGLNQLYKKCDVKLFASKEFGCSVDTLIVLLDSQYAFSPQSEVDKYGIRQNNFVVNAPSNFTSSKNEPPKNKTFDSIFKDFRWRFRLFLSQSYALINDRLGDGELTGESRLSATNLIMALEKLHQMQELFNQKFEIKNVCFDDLKEYQQILQLASVWTHLYTNTLRVTNSISCSQNEYVKKYRVKVANFFERDVAQYEGVSSFHKNGKVLELIVNAENLDSVCLKMFEDVKSKFNNMSAVTLESCIWNEYFSEIQIKLYFMETLLPGGFSISVDSFKLYDESDKFLQFRLPLENSNTTFENDAKGILLKCFATLEQMNLFVRHIQQINIEVSQICENILSNDVYDNWQNNSEAFFANVLTELCQELKLIQHELDAHIIEGSTFSNLIMQVENSQLNLAHNKNRICAEGVEELLCNLNQTLINFVNSVNSVSEEVFA